MVPLSLPFPAPYYTPNPVELFNNFFEGYSMAAAVQSKNKTLSDTAAATLRLRAFVVNVTVLDCRST